VEARLQIVAIVLSVGLFAFVFELVRRRRLMERYALLWLFAAAALLVLSVWGGLLNEIADLAGVRYGPSVLFAVALGFVFVLLLHFAVVISRLADQNKVLAQQLALLKREVEGVVEPQDESEDSYGTA
jgi:hypothetical protein